MLWAHTTRRGRADEVLTALGGAGKGGSRGAAGQRCLGVRALGLDVKGARCLKCGTTDSSQWGRRWLSAARSRAEVVREACGARREA